MKFKQKIAQAIKNKQILEFIYKGDVRIVEPYAIGKMSTKKFVLLSIQIGGHSNSGKLPDWRMFELKNIENIKILPRKFSSHFKTEELETNLGKIFDNQIKDINKATFLYLYDIFEQAAKQKEGHVYFLARDLQSLLNYESSKKFMGLIRQVEESYKADHADTSKDFSYVYQNNRLKNIYLSRHACNLIVNKIDSEKDAVTFARIYLTNSDIAKLSDEKRINELKRIKARTQFSNSEKYFSNMLMKHGLEGKNFGQIKSNGDKKLFGINTGAIKRKLKIKNNQTILDFMPDIMLKAKEFINALTEYNIEKNNINGLSDIKREYMSNNILIRELMIKSNLHPEHLINEEDIKLIEQRFFENIKKGE